MFLTIIISSLLYWDQELLLQINRTLSNGLFDVLMPWLRNKYFWLPLYVFILAFIGFHWKRKSWLVLFFLFLTFGAGDWLSAGVIKPLVQRERPCRDEQIASQLILRVACGGGYSFPSAHGTNHMGLAVFFFLLFGKIFSKGRYLFFLWAILISFAQVYVGVHYPSDLLAGWLLGSLLGMGLYRLMRFYLNWFYPDFAGPGLKNE